MLANPKYTLIAIAVATLASAGAVAVVGRTNAEESNEDRMIQDRIESFPLTIAISWQGPTNIPGRMPMWFLSVNSAGEGELTNRISGDDKRVSFKVSPKALANFRATLGKERLFGLKDKYGDVRIHGSTVFVTIVVGEFAKSVQIEDFGLALQAGDTKYLHEGARAVRCAIATASLYDEKLSTALKNDFTNLLRAVKE